MAEDRVIEIIKISSVITFLISILISSIVYKKWFLRDKTRKQKKSKSRKIPNHVSKIIEKGFTHFLSQEMIDDEMNQLLEIIAQIDMFYESFLSKISVRKNDYQALIEELSQLQIQIDPLFLELGNDNYDLALKAYDLSSKWFRLVRDE